MSDISHAQHFENFSTALTVDASQRLGPLTPFWRFFGCDEPNYCTMPNGRRLLGELGKLRPGDVYFRTHNLLTTGDCKPALKWGSTNAYTLGSDGNPVYDWTTIDAIFDAGLERGVRPYVQIGFMPEALTSAPTPYRHNWDQDDPSSKLFTGWAYPPTDYAAWSELVYQWVRHCVGKYGEDEVLRWYWEPWNEPNIGYWSASPEEFFKLYDFSADAVKRALPNARVGGPETAGGPGGESLKLFLEHCARGTNCATGRVGSPLDFVSFHAKGQPEFVDGHVRMGIAPQLHEIDAAFAVVASFPEFRNLPVVIGEMDPDGCAACRGPHLGYRNSALYPAFTAASFCRLPELAARHGIQLEGALTWAFVFEDVTYFAGFRQLATNGIDLPILNAFRMLSQMSGDMLRVDRAEHSHVESVMRDGVRGSADVSALATLDAGRLSVLIWHYHDDDVPGMDANIELVIDHLPWPDSAVHVHQAQVDENHSNSFTAWKSLRSPTQLSKEQLRLLEKAGRLESMDTPSVVSVLNGQLRLGVVLPRQSVVLIVVDCEV